MSRLDEAALKDDPVLAALDPGLDSVVNINEPDEYRTARAQPGPEITVQRFGVLANGHRAPETVHAATVAEAAAAAGVDFGGALTAALNGDQITRDGQTPLAAGDTVSSCPPTRAAEHDGSAAQRGSTMKDCIMSLSSCSTMWQWYT